MKYATDYVATTYAASTTAGTAKAANPNRRVLLLYNQSADTDVRINFAASTGSFITIPPGEGIKFDFPPLNLIHAWTASGTANLTVVEG